MGIKFEILDDETAKPERKFKFEIVEDKRKMWKEKILTLLADTSSNKPIDLQRILLLGKPAERNDIKVELDRLCNTCEVMNCTITRGKQTNVVYWKSVVPAPFLYAGGRMPIMRQNPPRRDEKVGMAA